MSIAELLVDKVKTWCTPHVYQLKTDKSTISSETITDVTTVCTGVQVAGGILTDSTAGGAVNLQLPTATDLLANFPTAIVGSVFKCQISAYGHATNALTLTTNTGLTLLATGNVIPAGTGRTVSFKVTNIGTPAISVY